jgi:hypothetical protein
MGVSSLPFNLPFDLILWGVLAAVLIVFNIFSAILLWHWRTYSTGRFTTVANMFMYLGVGVGLLIAMAVAAFSFSLV